MLPPEQVTKQTKQTRTKRNRTGTGITFLNFVLFLQNKTLSTLVLFRFYRTKLFFGFVLFLQNKILLWFCSVFTKQNSSSVLFCKSTDSCFRGKGNINSIDLI